MYNRYIPQSDGSYRKNRCPDQQPSPPRPSRPVAEHPEPTAEKNYHPSAGSFLKNLLPKEFDTGDLLIVLLLLLMAEQEEGGSNSALLTLALYFFM